MITHIVCWKYKEETSEAAREDRRSKLRELTTIIPEMISFDVGADILHLERSFDSGLAATFADRAALDRYTDHPAHQKVASLGREISERVVSVDFANE